MTTGDKAPDFSLFSDSRKQFSLSEARKDGPVLLLFFPAAFTGTCTTELNEVSNDLESYEPAVVVGISTDAPFALAEFSKLNQFRVSLLSDHDASVCAAYDCKYDSDFTSMKYDRIAKRGAFLIDVQGIVQYAEVLENAGDLPDLDAIKTVIERL